MSADEVRPSLETLASALRTRDLTVSGLVRHSLLHAQGVGAALNAFTTVRDAAATEAAEADRRGLSDSLLDGIPIAFKDMFDRPRHRCSFGASIGGTTALTAATVVAGLEEAGAITIGFLNMSEFALGPTGHNRTFGHCRNPWDPARVSGGSSSGAGAAVAAGIVAGAVGSDTGGSIRIPASCCGIVGLKPTQGRVSTQGALVLSPSLDCIGPLARTVKDCATLFTALIDLGATVTEGAVTSKLSAAKPGALRLRYPRKAVASSASAEIVHALDLAVRRLLPNEEAEPCDLPSILAIHELANCVQQYESAAAHARRLADYRAQYTPSVLRRIEPGFRIGARDYRAALIAREGLVGDFLDNVLAGADALVLPTVGQPVPRICDSDEEALGALPDLVAQMTHWTRWINYLGLPALSLPMGLDRNGMPMGLQLVGAPGSEFKLLAIGEMFQQSSDWHRMPPPVRVPPPGLNLLRRRSAAIGG